jgi:hypothetical protein
LDSTTEDGYMTCEREEMNTNAITHTDFIFSIAADWALLLPTLTIGAAVVGFATYKILRKKTLK